jgi:hypothetical protein
MTFWFIDLKYTVGLDWDGRLEAIRTFLLRQCNHQNRYSHEASYSSFRLFTSGCGFYLQSFDKEKQNGKTHFIQYDTRVKVRARKRASQPKPWGPSLLQ